MKIPALDYSCVYLVTSLAGHSLSAPVINTTNRCLNNITNTQCSKIESMTPLKVVTDCINSTADTTAIVAGSLLGGGDAGYGILCDLCAAR